MDASRLSPDIAAVVITRDRCDDLRRSLRHTVADSEVRRVVVVDKGSDDDTLAMLATEFPSVLRLPAQRNVGSAGRTLGIEEVDTAYVAFCYDDSWWQPGSLRRAAGLLDAHPKLGLVAGRVLSGPTHATTRCAG